MLAKLATLARLARPLSLWVGALALAGCGPATGSIPGDRPIAPEPQSESQSESQSQSSEGIPLAITIDDLPYVGPRVRGESVEDAVGRMVAALERHGAPATGFVVCDHLERQQGGLDPWLAGDLEVGNHSTSHTALDDLDLDTWREDVAACRDRLAAVTGSPPVYFRYPYLRTGRTRESRDAAAATLESLGHTRAPVSIDTSEWLLAGPYARAVAAGEHARAQAIADAYVDHIRLAARHYRDLARARVGRDIDHVLLLHANALAADHLDALLTMLEAEGFRFVSLERALRDPVYAEADDWVDSVGSSWLLRLAPAQIDGWGWDRGQQHALRGRFGLAEDDDDDSQRIGRALRVRKIPDTPAWVVTQTEPIAANSLVFETADGSPVLADTPWTPEATRELLDWVELRFGRPPALATVSHYHLDASGGIAALLAAGVPVVGSEHTATLLRERAPGMLDELARTHGGDFEHLELAQPDRTFSAADGWSETVGGTRVEVLFPGRGHSPDNVVTWFPDAGVLFGGCMVKGGDDLGWLGDADTQAWPAANSALIDLGARVVVPGHGERTDPGSLDNTGRLLDATTRP